MVPLVPPGPNANQNAVLQSLYDAVSALQTPGAPVALSSIDTKANLTAKAPAAKWPNGAILCAEINSIVCSTKVAGVWTWLRADGSAL